MPDRKVILSAGISLDGYIARPDGAVDFLFIPDDFPFAAFTATIDTAIMGRKTFEVARRLGDGSLGDPSVTNYVFSRSRPPGQRHGATFTSQLPASLIADLRQHSGQQSYSKDIWLMGGGELARAFLKDDLIDEIHLGIVPVVLGQGIPLFPAGFPQRNFTLIANESYSQGLVLLKYRRARS